MADASNNRFYLETSDVLGFKYQEYVADIRALALSKPAEYFQLRKEVLKSVKNDAVSALYKTLFNVLSTGTNIQGRPIGRLGSDFSPGYPSHLINDFSIGVASDLADHINRAVDIILPNDFEQIAAGKLNLKGKANVIEG
jgi:hypothetical protein